MICNKRTEKRL